MERRDWLKKSILSRLIFDLQDFGINNTKWLSTIKYTKIALIPTIFEDVCHERSHRI